MLDGKAPNQRLQVRPLELFTVYLLIFLTRLWKHDIDQGEWSPLKQHVYPQTVSWVLREESFLGLIVAEQQQRNLKMHDIKPNSGSDSHEEELRLGFFFF